MSTVGATATPVNAVGSAHRDQPCQQTPARLRVLNRALGQAALTGSEVPSDQFLFDSPTHFLMMSCESVGCHSQCSNFCGHHSLMRLAASTTMPTRELQSSSFPSQTIASAMAISVVTSGQLHMRNSLMRLPSRKLRLEKYDNCSKTLPARYRDDSRVSKPC